MARSISKNRIVRTVFTKLAPFYDAVDPWLTWRLGARWRKQAVAAAKLQSPRRVLDACAGSGLLTAEVAQAAGPRCHVIAIDFCPAMAAAARQRLHDLNLQRRVEFKVENAEIMPFPDEFFDAVFIAFGLRFVSDIRVVFKEFHRVLKPNGRLVVLELARPSNPILNLAAHLSRELILPAYGRLRHRMPSVLLHPLHDSLLHYPGPDKIGRMLMRTDFDEVEYRNLHGGLATLHTAVKLAEEPLLRYESQAADFETKDAEEEE